MPYVERHRRQALLAGAVPATAGELNFLISDLAGKYVARKGLRYAVLAQVTAALNDAKAEFERRVVAPYEDTKRKENGDVYPVSILGEGAGSPEHLAVAELLSDQPAVLAPSAVAASQMLRELASERLTERVRRNPDTGAREVWVPDSANGDYPMYGQWISVEG